MSIKPANKQTKFNN